MPTASAKFLLEAYQRSQSNALEMGTSHLLGKTHGFGRRRRETHRPSIMLNGSSKEL